MDQTWSDQAPTFFYPCPMNRTPVTRSLNAIKSPLKFPLVDHKRSTKDHKITMTKSHGLPSCALRQKSFPIQTWPWRACDPCQYQRSHPCTPRRMARPHGSDSKFSRSVGSPNHGYYNDITRFQLNPQCLEKYVKIYTYTIHIHPYIPRLDPRVMEVSHLMNKGSTLLYLFFRIPICSMHGIFTYKTGPFMG